MLKQAAALSYAVRLRWYEVCLDTYGKTHSPLSGVG
jgi:hypothetical protein